MIVPPATGDKSSLGIKQNLMLLEQQSLKLGKYIKDYREDYCQLIR